MAPSIPHEVQPTDGPECFSTSLARSSFVKKLEPAARGFVFRNGSEEDRPKIPHSILRFPEQDRDPPVWCLRNFELFDRRQDEALGEGKERKSTITRNLEKRAHKKWSTPVRTKNGFGWVAKEERGSGERGGASSR